MRQQWNVPRVQTVSGHLPPVICLPDTCMSCPPRKPLSRTSARVTLVRLGIRLSAGVDVRGALVLHSCQQSCFVRRRQLLSDDGTTKLEEASSQMDAILTDAAAQPPLMDRAPVDWKIQDSAMTGRSLAHVHVHVRPAFHYVDLLWICCRLVVGAVANLSCCTFIVYLTLLTTVVVASVRCTTNRDNWPWALL